MNELKLDLIQKLCDERRIIWSAHAAERMHQRGISRKDVLNAIQNGKIIEQYPDDYPYPSCLILGIDLQSQKIHIVCGSDGSIIKIITAYYPTDEKFDETKTFRKEHHQ